MYLKSVLSTRVLVEEPAMRLFTLDSVGVDILRHNLVVTVSILVAFY